MLRNALKFSAVLLGIVLIAKAAVAQVLVLDIEGRGEVFIELATEDAPGHVERIIELTETGAYNDVAFHRVIDGFMAQTGDVAYGKREVFGEGRAGFGGSDLPDLAEEFSDIPFERGTVGMARAQDPNSANSQFFIMFAEGPFLNGQYTVIGSVVKGMEVVDEITRGSGQNGIVADPDYIASARIE